MPPPARHPILARGTILTIVIIIAVVIVLIIAAAFAFFGTLTSSRTAEGALIGWVFSAGFGDSRGTADKTIAKAIGGQVYTDTEGWYESLFDMYRGNTRVNVNNLVMLDNESLSISMIINAQAAIALLAVGYGISVEQYRYASFQFTGLGYNDAKKTVGVLEVGSSWYVGYATGVVDLGNI